MTLRAAIYLCAQEYIKNGDYLSFGFVGVAKPDFEAMFRIIGLQDKLIFKVKLMSFFIMRYFPQRYQLFQYPAGGVAIAAIGVFFLVKC